MDLAHFAWSIRHFACLSGSAAFIVAGPADSIDWDVVLTCIPMALLGLIAHFPLALDVLLALCTHAILYAIASRPKSQSLPKESEVIAHSSPGLAVLQRCYPSLSVPSLSFPKRASEGTQSTQSTAPSSDIEGGDESQSQQCDESSAVEIHYLIFDIKQRFAEDFLIVLLIIAVAVCQLHPHPPWTAISLTVGLSVGITIFFQRRSKETLITPRRVPVSMPLATLAASLLGGSFQNLYMLPSAFLILGLSSMESMMTTVAIACFPLITLSLEDIVLGDTIMEATDFHMLLGVTVVAIVLGLIMRTKFMPSHLLTLIIACMPLPLIAMHFNMTQFLSFAIAWYLRTTVSDIAYLSRTTTSARENWGKAVCYVAYVISIAIGTMAAISVGIACDYMPKIALPVAIVSLIANVVLECSICAGWTARLKQTFFFTGILLTWVVDPFDLLRGVICGIIWSLQAVAYPSTSFTAKAWYPKVSLTVVAMVALYELYQTQTYPSAESFREPRIGRYLPLPFPVIDEDLGHNTLIP